MTVKFSIALTDEQQSFARELVLAGRYSSARAVLQQGIDLLRQRTQDEDLERAAQSVGVTRPPSTKTNPSDE